MMGEQVELHLLYIGKVEAIRDIADERRKRNVAVEPVRKNFHVRRRIKNDVEIPRLDAAVGQAIRQTRQLEMLDQRGNLLVEIRICLPNDDDGHVEALVRSKLAHKLIANPLGKT